MRRPVKIIPPRSRRRRRWRRGRGPLLALVVLSVGLWLAVDHSEALHWGKTLPWPQHAEINLPAQPQTIAVYNHQTGQIMQLDWTEYLVGVVAAEMPASFELEALKAQAVAARTFAQSRLQSPRAAANAPYRLTTDPATCQAWISADERQNRWGESFAANERKLRQAVAETEGEVITYQGALIEPLYHASCGGGRTESARDVWGGDRPYLQSVVCAHPADKHTQIQTTLTMAQIDARLGSDLSAIPAGLGQTKPIVIDRSSASNRVLDVRVGSQHYSGSAVRQALGLKSALFACQINGDQVTFTTNGYGHGVGMCQYGADYYAKEGLDYRAILQHYYTGVEIGKIVETGV